MSPQPHPAGSAVMFQNWRRLLFLHWAWEPAEVQASLPEGLSVDTWSGRAWLGVIPFKMESVRPRFFPAVPGLSNFPELNVRTYVRDVRGRPGIWFYSLDCSRLFAVWGARVGFGLPYFHARMREQPGERVFYHCRRRGTGESAYFEYAGEGAAERAAEGTVEQFLVERYRLFAVRGGRLLTGKVWHEPYPLQRTKVYQWDAAPLRQAGFDVGAREPDHAVFSPGVNVRIFAPERV